MRLKIVNKLEFIKIFETLSIITLRINKLNQFRIINYF